MPASAAQNEPPGVASNLAEPDHERLAFFDDVIRDWLADASTTLIAGRWSDGSIAELRPQGRATLSSPRYGGSFAGLRDLHLAGVEHHMHLDLARFRCVAYTIAPSVCFGFKPSLEARFMSADDGAQAGFAMSVGCPYRGEHFDAAAVRGYFVRLAAHARQSAFVRLDVVRCDEWRKQAHWWQQLAELASTTLAGVVAPEPVRDAVRALASFGASEANA